MRNKIISFCLVLLTFLSAQAQWDADPVTSNNPVSSIPVSETIGAMTTDGSGGTITAWENANNLYVQRKTVAGMVSWQSVSSPVLLFSGTGSFDVRVADMVADNNGGAYISFLNFLTDSTADLFLQHINSNGTKLFAGNGVKVNPPNTAAATEGKLCLTSDGVIIVWGTEVIEESNTPMPSHCLLFCQRFNANGQPLWQASGKPVSVAGGVKFWCEVLSDGNDGMYVSFTDSRLSTVEADGSYNNLNVYLQRLGPDGNRLWDSADVVVNANINNQISYNDYSPTGRSNRRSMIADGVGGVILVYEDYVNANFSDREILKAQRINSSGTLLWPAAGVAVDPQENNKLFLQIAAEGNGGCVLSWKNVGASAAVRAQRISPIGTVLWSPNGIVVNNENETDFFLTGISMAKDQSGNYIICWRQDSIPFSTTNLKAQKIDIGGNKLWSPGGIAVCSNSSANASYPKMLSSFGDSILIEWKDSRGIYSTLLKTDGTLTALSQLNYISTVAGNWNDPSIWVGGVVPPPGTNVTIANNVTINSNTFCNSLTVQAPSGNVIVGAGVTLTIFQ